MNHTSTAKMRCLKSVIYGEMLIVLLLLPTSRIVDWDYHVCGIQTAEYAELERFNHLLMLGVLARPAVLLFFLCPLVFLVFRIARSWREKEEKRIRLSRNIKPWGPPRPELPPRVQPMSSFEFLLRRLWRLSVLYMLGCAAYVLYKGGCFYATPVLLLILQLPVVGLLTIVELIIRHRDGKRGLTPPPGETSHPRDAENSGLGEFAGQRSGAASGKQVLNPRLEQESGSWGRLLLLVLLAILEVQALPDERCASLLLSALPLALTVSLVFLYGMCRDGKGFGFLSAIPVLLSFLPLLSADSVGYVEFVYALWPVWAVEILLIVASSRRFPRLHAAQFGLVGKAFLYLMVYPLGLYLIAAAW